jgi:Mn2+/Fe2+ NRAMP family transporter
MPTPEILEPLRLPIRNLKIICGTLIAVVSISAALVLVVVGIDNLHARLPLLVALAAGSGITAYIVSQIAFQILAQHTSEGARKKSSAENNLRLLQTAWIVRYGLVVAICFLNLIVTMLEKSVITMFVAVLGILIMLITFPRTEKVLKLLESRTDEKFL